MGLFPISLVIATFLTALVAGFLFAFAVVVMPGIRKLEDGEFLRAFQVMDRIIQDNQPLFILVWVGSAIGLIASTVIGVGQLDPVGRTLMISAVVIYLLGVQLPTMTINIPLNKSIQALDIADLEDSAHASARAGFEDRWNRWNVVRTWLSSLVTLTLLVLLLRQ